MASSTHTPRRSHKKRQTLEDVTRAMQERGLEFVKRDEPEKSYTREKVVIDEKAEAAELEEFFKECEAKGLHHRVSIPWHQGDSDADSDDDVAELPKHIEHAFVFPMRAVSKYPKARLLVANMVHQTVQYLNDQQELIKERSLIGSKVSTDLVSKNRFSVMYRGETVAVDHTCYREGYRDHAIDVLRLRVRPEFNFAGVHEGTIAKRSNRVGGLLYNDRFARIANGHFMVYKAKNSKYPYVSICVAGEDVTIARKGSKQISIECPERGFAFKLKSRDEQEQWWNALQLAIERSQHEWELIRKHLQIAMQERRRRKKEKRARKKRQHRSGMLLESKSSASIISTTSSMSSMMSMSQSAVDLTPQVRIRRTNSYLGGHGEFEVHLQTDGKEVPIGFIEVEDNETLATFRMKMSAELDNLPNSWVFIRMGVPVGTRQEAKKRIEYVVDNDLVRIKAK